MKVSLRVLLGSNAGRKIKVTGTQFLIGRSDKCQLRPSSELISRQHCALVVVDSELFVRDLRSHNGVFVNDVKIETETKLTNGDRFRIGKLEFEVLIELAPVSASGETSGSTSDTSEQDINMWLHEEEAGDQLEQISNLDTRQFKMEETDQIRLEETPTEDSQDTSLDARKADKEEPKEDKRKKKPGKLPKSATMSGKDSGEAAAGMLQKFFNRR